MQTAVSSQYADVHVTPASVPDHGTHQCDGNQYKPRVQLGQVHWEGLIMLNFHTLQ